MTHTIDAGIGIITANCADNLKIKMFLDSLKDQIEIGKLDEIIQFVDGGCESGTQILKDEIYELKEELNRKEEEISNLESDIEELEEDSKTEHEIETGLGKLGYNSDNLAIQSLMENLEEACRKTSPIKVSQILESVN